ncbi:MAG TPA: hypothetical protein VF692_06650 [Pyrinomonadaceae bacterium]|jgi:hypothetical protein
MKQISFTFILILAFCVFSFAQNEKSPCPTIKLIGPSFVLRVDEPALFTVELSAEAKIFKIEYQWSVERGEIAGGQGTTQISVLPKIEGANLKATIKIKGLPENCSDTESELAGIAQLPIIEPFDDYGKISLKDEYARLDAYITRLSEDKSYKGYIHIFTDKNKSNDAIKKRIRLLLKHIKFRNFPKDRLTFAIEKSGGHMTLLYIFWADSKFPACKNCEILKGKDL